MNAQEQSPQKELAPKSSWIKHVIAGLFGAVLLWLAFRGCNFAEIWNYAKAVNPIYVALIFASCIITHFLRAWRWIFLLKPLMPENRKPSLWNSFCAVVYGYAVNAVIPKGGEIVRMVSMSKMENLPWAGVLPTLLIDRLLDVLCLAIMTGLTLTILPDSVKTGMPWITTVGFPMLGGALVALIFLPKLSVVMRWFLKLGFVQKLLPEMIKSKIGELMDQFEIGSSGIANPVMYPLIALATILMWVLYWANFYLMVYGFGLENTVKLADSVIVFTIGSVSNFIPTPGSVGGFHVFVKESLMLTSSVNPDQAMAFATVLHLMCYLVTTFIPAGICYLVNMLNSRKTGPAI